MRCYTFGSFRVDVERRRLYREGQAVPLTPKVFDTLVVLIERQGALVTRAELLRQIWGDTAIEEGGLTRNISVLRKALGERADEPQYIVTTPGHGYRFIGQVTEETDALTISLPAPLPEACTYPPPEREYWTAVRADAECVVPRAACVVWPPRRRYGTLLVAAAGLMAIVCVAVVWLSRGWGDTRQADRASDPDVIAGKIVDALAPRLATQVRERRVARETTDAAAYRDYLLGRASASRRTEADVRRAIGYFIDAIDKDAHYARAQAALADCYTLLAIWGAAPPGETLFKAKTAALRAVALDDDLAEALSSAAFIAWVSDLKWAGAEEAFQRALAAGGDQAPAHQRYAFFLIAHGRVDAAMTEIARARRLDPRSAVIATNVGEILGLAGRHNEAIAALRATLHDAPDFVPALTILGMTYVQEGRLEEGIAALERAHRLEATPLMSGALGYAYAVAGRKVEARAMLAELQSLSARRYVSPFAYVLVYAALGDAHATSTWLARADSEQAGMTTALRLYPWLDHLRHDPPFRDLVQRVEGGHVTRAMLRP